LAPSCHGEGGPDTPKGQPASTNGDQQGASLRDIAQEIPNLEGNPPGVATVKRVLDRFSTRLGKFQSDALRYPILIVKGASGSGKTEWAQS